MKNNKMLNASDARRSFIIFLSTYFCRCARTSILVRYRRTRAHLASHGGLQLTHNPGRMFPPSWHETHLSLLDLRCVFVDPID